jgi:hypothetical protein
MNQLPSWVQYTQALAPPFIALVAGISGGYIAYRQWRTGHYQLRLDLFDRRFAVYKATQDLVRVALSDGYSDGRIAWRLLRQRERG